MLVSLQFGIDERCPSTVFVRKYRRSAGQWPFYANRRIIPFDAAIELRSVVFCGFIKKFRELGYNQESVREAFRDPQLPLVLRRQADTNPFTKCPGLSSQINGNIKDLTGYHTDKLPLRATDLIMQSAQNAFY